MALSESWGCNSTTPIAHPWHGEISDVACGYERRLLDERCGGCRRSRAENPADQIARLADNRR